MEELILGSPQPGSVRWVFRVHLEESWSTNEKRFLVSQKLGSRPTRLVVCPHLGLALG